MLEKNQRILSVGSSVLDALLLFAAYLLANFLRFNFLPYIQPGGAGPALDIAQDTIFFGAIYAVIAVRAFRLWGLDRAPRLRGAGER